MGIKRDNRTVKHRKDWTAKPDGRERPYVLGLVCLSCLVSAGTSAVPHDSPRPNILYIMADDLGFNDVSWHNPDVITPNLQNMVDNGVTLNQTYAQAACTPSRAAYLTGLYPFRIGVQNAVVREGSADYVPLDIPFLPERLKEAGYSTHLVGKWHLGHCRRDVTPIARGFDSFLGPYSGYNDYFTKKIQLIGSHEDFDPNAPGWVYDFFKDDDVYFTSEDDYTTEIFTNRTIKLIKRSKKKKPFFIALHYTAPHWPLQVPPHYLDYYPNVNDTDRRTYLAMVTAMDEGIGKVMQALEKKNIMHKTIVIFVSDNGGDLHFAANNDPLRDTKATLYEGGTRVPGFVYSPHLITNTPRVSDDLFHMVDWFSTILGVAGVNPGNVDGMNQWDMLRYGVEGPRDSFIYNIFGNNSAIRAGRYKLIEGDPTEFQARRRRRRRSAGENPSASAAMRTKRDCPPRRPLESDLDKMMKAFNQLSGVSDIENVRKEGGWTMDGILEVMESYGEEDITESFDCPQCQLYDVIEDPSETQDLVETVPGVVLYLHRLLQLYQAEETEPVLKFPWAQDPRFQNVDNITSNTWCEEGGVSGR